MKYMLIGAAVGGMAGAAIVMSSPYFRPTAKRMLAKKKRRICLALRRMGI